MRWNTRAMVFLDFDGTITRRDATDAILDCHADPRWRQIEEAWRLGRIGSRECLEAQMALVTATRTDIDALLDDIDVDPGLAPLLDVCSARGVQVSIVSDGFDYCIDRILSRPSLGLVERLKDVRIVSSHLEVNGTRWKATFTRMIPPCLHGCATCKPAVMELLNTDHRLKLFVGDGFSDKYAAAHADVVFAKDALADFCDHRAIPYTPYDTLAAVARRCDHLLRSNDVHEMVSPNS